MSFYACTSNFEPRKGLRDKRNISAIENIPKITQLYRLIPSAVDLKLIFFAESARRAPLPFTSLGNMLKGLIEGAF